MTNVFQPKTIAQSTRRDLNPGEGELLAVFQLVTDAALLVDMRRDRVVRASTAFFNLTGFAMDEVLDHSPRDFFPDLPPQALTGDELFYTLIERRGQSPLAVSIQPRWLNPTGSWRVFIFNSQLGGSKKAVHIMERLTTVLSRINQIPLLVDKDLMQSNFTSALDMVRTLFSADVVGIYQVNPDTMSLNNLTTAGENNLLPATLSLNDQARLTNLFVWKPGRRVQTELHRKARIEGLGFVISAPLAPNGLLVLGSRQKDPMVYQEELFSVLVDRLGSLLRYYVQYQEVNDRLHEIEKELRVWQQAVESVKEGILILSPELSVRQMNPAAEWMLGYASKEVQGQPVENILIGPNDLFPALQDALAGVPIHSMGVVYLHRRNGQSFPAEIQVIPVQRRLDRSDENSSLDVMIGFRDVSADEEIRQRSQQLEQRAVLGEVTAVFAHEVRNPINNISTGLQLLAVKLPENDPNQENITRLINDCHRLDHLMESVLNFSRQVEHKFEEVDLEVLLRRLLDRWRPRMNKVNVNGFFHYEEGTPHVLGDPRSLEQVFTNLISNAVEAMSTQGGNLAIKVSSFHQLLGRPQIEVTVSDSGPGIPDEVLERIFEPFVTTKPQGTGLGLAITKRIVTAHHGSIQATSFPGGSVFHVQLLAYQGEAA